MPTAATAHCDPKVLPKYPPRLPPMERGFDNENTNICGKHMNYHSCHCYGHTKGLPDYRLLAQPRTSNYYASAGGCPCIPRAAAHPGSWRLKQHQMRSATHRCTHGCVNRLPQSHTHDCCIHDGYQYGWRPGPHRVKSKNTACRGKCDTFGNLAFKSRNKVYLPEEDNVSEVSSAGSEKLGALEDLILEEHQSRQRAEMDVNQLKDIKGSNTANLYKDDRAVENSRKKFAQPTEEILDELLRQIKGITKLPLHQINMELLNRIIERQEMIMAKRQYDAGQKYKLETIAKEYAEIEKRFNCQNEAKSSTFF